MSRAVILVHEHPQRDTFPQQLAFFQERILPGLQAMPGFVSGSWAYDPARSQTHSYVVYSTETEAQSLVDLVQSESEMGNPFQIKLLSATIATHNFSRP